LRIALALQVAGCVALIVGAALVAPWLGFVVAGVCGLAFGIALERGF
jgi:integral membrane sensor domain MASE1